MAFHTLALEANAVDVAISKSGSRLAVLSNNNLAVYALDMHRRPIPKPAFLWQCNAINAQCPRHVTFIGDEELFCLTDNWDDESCLWRSEGDKMVPQGPIIEAEGISALTSDLDYKALFIQFQNGALYNIITSGVSTDLPPQIVPIRKFPSLAPEAKIATIDGEVFFSSLALLRDD
jgi:elongator complex protein 1